ncbi:MAG: hypothetical protein KC731_14925, partial [Myxococcales bacterium]|nr:hypothetical protein [Myxococcales bacterium]
YLAALGRDVAKRATEVHLAWSPEGGDFGNTLASAGIGTGRYRKLQDALAEVVDELIQLSQTMEGMKLAAPLGRRDGGIPQPDAAEAPLAYNGRADLLANLDGLEAVYRVSLDGKTGVSLYQDTANRQPGLHEALDRQLTVCRATLVEIDEPIPVLVTSGRTEGLEAAFLCHQELLRMLQTDLAGVLGVTPTFGESDGD